MNKRLLMLAALTAGLLVSLFVGYGSIHAEAPKGYLRVIHVSPNAPAVDIYLNNTALGKPFNFGDTTDFMSMPSGRYTVDLRPAGAAASSQPIYTTDVYLAGGASVNLVALGTLGSGGAQAFKVAAFLTNRMPTQGKARVEVIHAAPNLPTIDVLHKDKTVLTEIKFSKEGDSPLNLEPGPANITAAPTGKSGASVIDLSDAKLEADKIYTVIAVSVNQPQGQPAQPLVLTTTPN
jgi:hypothetical protein